MQDVASLHAACHQQHQDHHAQSKPIGLSHGFPFTEGD
jgi:hypothetical protein